MSPSRPVPVRLWVVRHGESAGNVARDRAEAERRDRIELGSRDVDVPLSPQGQAQAAALGTWLASLDGLTRQGITSLYPEESERRRQIGKFYHRPPGGESWSDVLLRLRAALGDLQQREAGERVLLVAHQVVVLLVRYVLEGLSEQEVLAIDRQADVLNCSVTTYVDGGSALVLESFNDVGHLERSPAAVTDEPDVARAPR